MRTAGASSAALLGVMRVVPGAADHVRRDDVVHAGESRRTSARRAPRVRSDVPRTGAGRRGRSRTCAKFAQRAPGRMRLADGRVVDGTYADRHSDTVSIQVPGTFAWGTRELQSVMASSKLLDLRARSVWPRPPVVHTPTMYWSCATATAPERSTDEALAYVPHGLRRCAVDPCARLSERRRHGQCTDAVRAGQPSGGIAFRQGGSFAPPTMASTSG